MKAKIDNALSYAVARCQEVSTWRGIVLVVTAFGAKIDPDKATAIITAGIALAGFVGAMLPDTKVPNPPVSNNSPIDQPK